MKFIGNKVRSKGSVKKISEGEFVSTFISEELILPTIGSFDQRFHNTGIHRMIVFHVIIRFSFYSLILSRDRFVLRSRTLSCTWNSVSSIHWFLLGRLCWHTNLGIMKYHCQFLLQRRWSVHSSAYGNCSHFRLTNWHGV